MSSSGQGPPGDKKNEPKGLKKFLRRASLVLKPKSKRQSVLDVSAFTPNKASGGAGESSGTAPVSPPAVTSAPAKAESAPTLSVPAQMTQAIKDNKPVSTPIKRMTPKETNALHEEKAKALFAKYGLTLEPGEWTTPVSGGALRVEKLVRMRIHRTCHRCQTTFGADRLCNNCQHTRCKKCPGRPTKVAKGKGTTAGGVAVDDNATRNDQAMTMPHRASGKEMTRKTPTQRVRRTCHVCQTLFVGKGVRCENCGHASCVQCPRDPPKTSKYPEGYPGDTQETYASGQPETNIGSSPPRGTRPDDQAVDTVEERMRNLDISPGASAA